MNGLTLVIPTNWESHQQINVGTHHVEARVLIDPELPTRGLHQPAYGGSTIRLREWNQQVLLHEILHAALMYVPKIRTETDPEGHDIINRVEVAVWETGWRRAPEQGAP